jgi:hypothetical protein
MFEYGDRTQASCRESGLDCESCTAQTATELARTCKGLRGKMVAQLFVQLYPEPACSKMHAHFASVYRSASRVDEEWESVSAPVIQEAATERRPRVIFAVA